MAYLLKHFGGHELYLDKNYVRKDDDQIILQADGSYLLLPKETPRQRVDD